jgi:hypothetical protein
MVATIITNAKDVAKLLEELDTKIRLSRGRCSRDLGAIFKESAEQRIKTKNEGQWAKASKWILAKRGIQHEILEGAEKFVYARASATGWLSAAILAKIGPSVNMMKGSSTILAMRHGRAAIGKLSCAMLLPSVCRLAPASSCGALATAIWLWTKRRQPGRFGIARKRL